MNNHFERSGKVIFLKRIAVDMDEVIADFSSKLLMSYNQRFADSITIHDIQGKRPWKARPNFEENIRTFITDPQFFRDLQVINGSQEVLAELNKHYEIFIATAAMEVPSSFAAKYEWLKENFSFLNDRNFVFCGDKSIIHADFLIDDSVHHFKRFCGKGILFSAPHNLSETGYLRVNNWQEVKQYFLSGITPADSAQGYLQ